MTPAEVLAARPVGTSILGSGACVRVVAPHTPTAAALHNRHASHQPVLPSAPSSFGAATPPCPTGLPAWRARWRAPSAWQQGSCGWRRACMQVRLLDSCWRHLLRCAPLECCTVLAQALATVVPHFLQGRRQPPLCCTVLAHAWAAYTLHPGTVHLERRRPCPPAHAGLTDALAATLHFIVDAISAFMVTGLATTVRGDCALLRCGACAKQRRRLHVPSTLPTAWLVLTLHFPVHSPSPGHQNGGGPAAP